MIYMFLAEGFEEVEALAPLDLIRRAGLEIKTVGVGSKTVVGSHGIPVVADMTADELSDDAPDMVILPGGMPGTKNLDASETVHKAIADAVRNDAYVCAICAAPMILGKLGLVRGRTAVCYPGFEKYLDGATVSDKKVVRDGKIITAKGMGAAVEFGLAIVEALRDAKTADDLATATIAK
jgi:4-methyl-5(b-hydroxyethyl)-thiazole monophosphate biosynthesis